MMEGCAAIGQEPRRGWKLVLWLVMRAARFLLLLTVAMVTILPFTVILGNTLRPRIPTRRTPESIGVQFQAARFETADGLNLDGWWIPAAGLASERTMLVCHGVGANRDDILRFIPFLHEAGYNVLTWDWRGHGLSDWAQVTYGLNEKKDVRAAIEWLKKEKPTEIKWLGALGISMGAGILVQAGPSCPEVKAFVLDSPFASVRTMLPFMLRTLPGLLRDLVCALTAMAARVVVGTSVDGVAPVNFIGQIAPRPIFMSHGKADRVIPWQETPRLEEAAKGPVEIWLVPDIQHTELREYHSEEYHRRVLKFLAGAREPASAR